jgi:UDP-N-acetylmuramoylalanine--D-glutamate ligase
VNQKSANPKRQPIAMNLPAMNLPAMNLPVTNTAITVVGAAQSGQAVARLLADAGAAVFLTEHGPPPADAAAMDALREAGVDAEFGGHTNRALKADLLVLSPGVPTEANLVQHALASGLRVVSEIEAASWFCRAPMGAITGTNGKTTTTRLAGHLLRTALPDARRVIVAGNIGVAFAEVVRDARPQDVVVLEVSSFQLDHVDTFRPDVSAFLNLTPDHLNRYGGSVEAYAQSKANIMRRQGAGDAVVYNRDDATVRRLVKATADPSVQRLPFSQARGLDAGAFLDSDALVLKMDPLDRAIRIPRDALALPGPHNLYNAQAAVLLAARLLRVVRFEASPDALRSGLATIAPVPHRMEPVATVGGVLYVNDSKATNVDAVGYALQSFDRPVVLVAGGRDKGNDYSTLQPLIRDHVRAVVALGESAETVARELGAHAPAWVRAESLGDAVREAHRLASEGDVVLLSPACSSFDMFANYKDRGERFRACVHALPDAASHSG